MFTEISADAETVATEASLREAMGKALEEYRSACGELRSLTGTIPLNAGSDGVLLLEKVSQKRKEPLERYREAVGRYYEFVRSSPLEL